MLDFHFNPTRGMLDNLLKRNSENDDAIRESAKLCPPERILYETDSPYLAPVPMRGRPSVPAYTEYTLSFLAALRGEDREELKAQVLGNLRSVLGKEESIVKRALS